MNEDVNLPPLPADRYSMTGDMKDANWILVRDVREYARLAVLQERERCAKLCWDRSDDGDGSEWDSSAIACAERIRAGHSVTETKRD